MGISRTSQTGGLSTSTGEDKNKGIRGRTVGHEKQEGNGMRTKLLYRHKTGRRFDVFGPVPSLKLPLFHVHGPQ